MSLESNKYGMWNGNWDHRVWWHPDREVSRCRCSCGWLTEADASHAYNLGAADAHLATVKPGLGLNDPAHAGEIPSFE